VGSQKGSSSPTTEALIGNARAVLTRRHVMIGLGGEEMTEDMIQIAQAYLTMATKGNGKKKILDIDRLLKKHPSEEVINLLKTILKEKQIVLRDFILADKSKPEIDETVAIMFRVTMAIRSIESIEDGKEVREH
jgi:membrane carboxypeptidase/penicillin-binding protein PbpC